VVSSGDVIGVAMYRADHWARLRATAADADTLAESHEVWLRSARASLAGLRQRGVRVREVPVDVEQVIAWCAAQGLPNTAQSRGRYVAELVKAEAAQAAAEAAGDTDPTPPPA
jgi:hypothetical protein